MLCHFVYKLTEYIIGQVLVTSYMNSANSIEHKKAECGLAAVI